jgi:hypothetical protein
MMYRGPVLHAVKAADGTVIATYAEEVPLSDVRRPSDSDAAKSVWSTTAAVDDAWRCECGPRLVKVAVPIVPGAVDVNMGTAPVLIDVYVQPTASIVALDSSMTFDTKLRMVKDDVPDAPDFSVYGEQAQGISVFNNPSKWDARDFATWYRRTKSAELPTNMIRRQDSLASGPSSPHALDPSGVSSFRVRRKQGSAVAAPHGPPATDASEAIRAVTGDVLGGWGLSGSQTEHGRLVDVRFHRTMTAFCWWASDVLQRQQLAAAESIVNERFSFEYAAALRPRLEANACRLGVQSGASTTTVHVQLRLFADPVSEFSSAFRSQLRDLLENWTLAELAEGDGGWDPDSPLGGASAQQLHSQSASLASLLDDVVCTTSFEYSIDHDPHSMPRVSGMATNFSCTKGAAGSSAAALAHTHAAEGSVDAVTSVAVAAALRRRLLSNPVPPPPAGRDDTLLDIVPAMERHILATVVAPLTRWLRLVGAFRAVFGSVISDNAVGTIANTKTVQFLVVDSMGAHQLAVVVSLTWQTPVPFVTYTSAQHMGTNLQPLTVAWMPPSPAPSLDDPCGVASSAFQHLHDNMHKLAKVCEQRGMHATR